VQSAGASRAASHTTSANIAITPEIILLRVSSLAPASHFLICTIQFQKLPLTNAGSIAGARISWQWNWLKKVAGFHSNIGNICFGIISACPTLGPSHNMAVYLIDLLGGGILVTANWNK
jgi:hypothetical protein